MSEISIIEQTENAKAASSALFESQRLAAAAVVEIQAKLAEITAAATQAIAAGTQISDNQAIIATKSDHIQKAQEHADKVRADLDRALTAATQQVTETEALKSSADSAADKVAEIVTDLEKVKAKIEADAGEITTTRETVEESAAVTKRLADKSATVETRVTAYEKRLTELEAQAAEQLKRIETLLPGATSAGLAYSFDVRRKTFVKPHDRWQWIFVCSVLAIVILAITGLWHVYNSPTTPTWDELVRLWLSRAPVAAALVWLALHASRESALAKRLEEDYGYKSAIASCFEGFQKQVSEVGKEVEPASALAKLLENTLATIASPPGRIYDKHELTVSPTDELKEAAKAAAELTKAVKP